MSAQQRMKVANEKASKNITQRGNVIRSVVSLHVFQVKPTKGVACQFQ